jgi:hypothetical protein
VFAGFGFLITEAHGPQKSLQIDRLMRNEARLPAVTQPRSFQELLQAGAQCGDSFGGPPPRSSLQTFEDTIVLYLPKQCLLDPKVERRTV